MNVDKFGLHMYKKITNCNDNQIWWINTNDGNISARSKIIKHLLDPIDTGDSATKGYVDSSLEHCLKKLKYIEQFLNELSNKITHLETYSKNEQSRHHK